MRGGPKRGRASRTGMRRAVKNAPSSDTHALASCTIHSRCSAHTGVGCPMLIYRGISLVSRSGPADRAKSMWHVSSFEIDGTTVQAPGFGRESFTAFVERAKATHLRTTPGGMVGTVLVLSGSSDTQYAVTRTAFAREGHRRHGRCWRRAYAIWLADVAGVDVTRITTIGVGRCRLPPPPGGRW